MKKLWLSAATLLLAALPGLAQQATVGTNDVPVVEGAPLSQSADRLPLKSLLILMRADIDVFSIPLAFPPADSPVRKTFAARLQAIQNAMDDAAKACADLSTPAAKSAALKKLEAVKSLIGPVEQSAEQSFEYNNMRGYEFLWTIIPEVREYVDRAIAKVRAA